MVKVPSSISNLTLLYKIDEIPIQQKLEEKQCIYVTCEHQKLDDIGEIWTGKHKITKIIRIMKG